MWVDNKRWSCSATPTPTFRQVRLPHILESRPPRLVNVRVLCIFRYDHNALGFFYSSIRRCSPRRTFAVVTGETGTEGEFIQPVVSTSIYQQDTSSKNVEKLTTFVNFLEQDTAVEWTGVERNKMVGVDSTLFFFVVGRALWLYVLLFQAMTVFETQVWMWNVVWVAIWILPFSVLVGFVCWCAVTVASRKHHTHHRPE